MSVSCSESVSPLSHPLPLPLYASTLSVTHAPIRTLMTQPELTRSAQHVEDGFGGNGYASVCLAAPCFVRHVPSGEEQEMADCFSTLRGLPLTREQAIIQ